MVFELLTESGLGQFYELASAPGARVEQATAQRQWAFPDDPAMRPESNALAPTRFAADFGGFASSGAERGRIISLSK